MPLYRITSETSAPFLTWGRTIGEAAASYAQQLHGARVFARRTTGEGQLSGWFHAYAPTGHPMEATRVGEPFRVAED